MAVLAGVTVPPVSVPAFAGLTVHHALLTFDASGAAALDLLP